MKRPILPLLLIFGLSGCGAPGPRPSIVLITFDAARADHTSAYGYSRPTTPVLDKLARKGTLFEQAYAHSDWTLAAMGALLTGLEPGRHGAVTPLRSVRPEAVTLPELLAREGYQTAAFGSSLFHDAQHGLGRGFRTYETLDPVRTDATALTAKALDWLTVHAKRPYFLWVHYPHPHAPFRMRQPWYGQFHPGRYAGGLDFSTAMDPNTVVAPGAPIPPDGLAHLIASYDSELAFTDDAIQSLLKPLDPKETVVAVSSDHGEELRDRGCIGHGLNLNVEVIKIPLILAGPGIPEGKRVASAVQHLDLMPTLLALAGVPPPDGLTGQSLLPVMHGEPLLERPIFGEQMESSDVLSVYSLVEYPWHLILQYGRNDQKLRSTQLFELSSDPAEQRNVFDGRRERDVALRNRLEAYVTRMGGPLPPTPPTVPATPELVRRLRAPGYLKAW